MLFLSQGAKCLLKFLPGVVQDRTSMTKDRRTEVPSGQAAEVLPPLPEVLVNEGKLKPGNVHGRVSGKEDASMAGPQEGQLALAVAGNVDRLQAAS